MITSRRSFLKTAALGSASLVIAFDERRLFAAGKEAPGQFKPNGWVAVNSDGTITLTIGKSEMGQGVRTSLAMILADELEADWSHIKLVQASPGPEFPHLRTTGSFSLGQSWKTLRQAGAAARDMLISAAAAKWKVEASACSAANAEVIHSASKRRLKYAALVTDAAKLPVPENPELKDSSQFRLIGKPTKRIEGRDIVTGAARFGIDTKLPGMLYASIERPPRPGATPKRMPDLTTLNVPGVRFVPCASGIAAVGQTTWASLKGRAALETEWVDPPEGAFDSETHLKNLANGADGKGFVTRKEGPPPGSHEPMRTIYATYLYPFYVHAPMETMNCVADVHPDHCVIWAPTQAPDSVQQEVAKFLGMPPEKVEVNVTLMGGGFGRRIAVDYALEAAELSRAVQAPVQVLWTRTDDMRHGHFQAASAHRLSAGLDSADAIVTWRHTEAGSPHNLRAPDPKTPMDASYYQDLSWGVYDVPYVIPSIETAYVTIDSPVPHGPWRSVFASSSVFARESFLDEVAHIRGNDPLALRLELLQGPDTFQAGSLTIDRRRLRRVLEVVRDKSGWDGKTTEPGRGRGVACNVYDGDTHIAYVVDVAVDKTGKVRVERVVAAVDCGLVVNPTGVEQQVEGGIIWGLSSALMSEITFRNGEAQQASYADYRVARMLDSPIIEVHIVPSDATQPFGIGEPPVPPIAPAIANAIFAATGKRIRRLPIHAEELKGV